MKKPTVIYFDGSCELCSDLVAKQRQNKEDYSLIDVSQAHDESVISSIESWKHMHVITPDGEILKGVDAILNVMQEKWYAPLLLRLVKIPLFRSLAEVGYDLFSRVRHFFSTPQLRLDWLIRVVSLGVLGAVLAGPELWFSNIRSFPLLPLFSSFALLSDLDSFLTILLSIGVVGLVLYPRNKRILTAVIIAIFLLVLLDYSRWQPWLYQYAAMLIVASFTRSAALSLVTLQIMQAMVYFWAGVQKVNVTFLTQVFPWMMEPVQQFFPFLPAEFPLWLGFLIPITEIAIGIGLLFRTTRLLAVGMAVGTHLVILLIIGPFGHNWNAVVWPWNLAMIGITGVLFLLSPLRIFSSLPSILTVRYGMFLLMFVVMPVFSFGSQWDSYLSFALYSGNTYQARLVMTPQTVSEASSFPNLPKYATVIDNEVIINIDAWAMDQFHASMYPEPRVYELVFDAVCRDVEHTENVLMHVWTRPEILTGKREIVVSTCDDVALRSR